MKRKIELDCSIEEYVHLCVAYQYLSTHWKRRMEIRLDLEFDPSSVVRSRLLESVS